MVKEDHSDYRLGAWMSTYTGKKFWPLDPRPEDICIVDIAHALSLISRFGGHTNEFYSVAQHSVHVAYSLPEETRLWGLLHDATEAYIGDMILPLKASEEFQNFVTVEARLMAAVCERFGLPKTPPPAVKVADRTMLVTEARDLMEHTPEEWHKALGVEPQIFKVSPWSPLVAESMFLDAFDKLTSKTPENIDAAWQ